MANLTPEQHAEAMLHLQAIAHAMGGSVLKEGDYAHWNVWLNFEVPEGVISLHQHERSVREGGPYIHVSGEWPRDRAGGVVTGRDAEYGTSNPAMNVSASKSPEVAAREIRRRFMPEFSRLYAKAREYIDQRNSYANQVEANYKAIAKACGGSVSAHPHKNTEFWLTGLPQGVRLHRMSAKTITLEVELPPDEACRLVREIAARPVEVEQ